MFIRILRTLLGIYAIIIFAICLVIVFICYIILFTVVKKEKAPFVAHKYISRPWARTLLICFGVRHVVKGRELLDQSQAYVFIANHRSQLDIPSYALATKHTMRFLAKAELTKIPLMGFIIKRLYVTVDRKNKEARQKSMENMEKSIREKISVFICPEGTRNKGSEPLLPFHDGAFRLAIQTQTPIAAMVIINSDKLLSPLRPIELSPGKVVCHWLPPFSVIGLTEDDLPALKERVMNEMRKIL